MFAVDEVVLVVLDRTRRLVPFEDQTARTTDPGEFRVLAHHTRVRAAAQQAGLDSVIQHDLLSLYVTKASITAGPHEDRSSIASPGPKPSETSTRVVSSHEIPSGITGNSRATLKVG